jgi:hypothetical protein
MSYLRQDTVKDEYGRGVSGASVYVFDSSGGYAALTTDGAVAIEQPVISNEFGVYSYYASEGFYREDIWYGGKLRYQQAGVPVGDAVAFLADATHRAEAAEQAILDIEGAVLAELAGISLSSVSLTAADRTVLAALNTSLGLPAVLIENGRFGIFDVVNYASVTAVADADDPAHGGRQGLFVKSTYDATKVWRRRIDAEVYYHWWGAIQGDAGGGNAAANDLAWTAMMATLGAMRWNVVSSAQGSLNPIRIGPGKWERSTPMECKQGTVKIDGCGSGHGPAAEQSSAATIIKCYNTTGLLLQETDTSGAATKDVTSHFGASRSAISNMAFEGNFTSAEAEYHGVHARTVAFFTDVSCRNFAGDGFHLWGDSTGPTGGSVDCSRLVGCEAWNCRDGVALMGADSNVVQVIGGLYNSNRRWGLAEYTPGGLGNIYTGVETSRNGLTAYNNGTTIPATIVSYGGNRYGPRDGQEVWAAANAPSGDTTDNQGWIFLAAGGVGSGVPAWYGGISIRTGGCFFNSSLVAASVYTGCYAELDQGKAQLKQNSIILAGHLATYDWFVVEDPTAVNSPVILAAGTSTLQIRPCMRVVSGDTTSTFGSTAPGNPSDIFFEWNHPLLTDVNGAQWMIDGAGDFLLTMGRVGSNAGFRFTGPESTTLLADGAPHPHSLFIPRLYLGNESGLPSTGRLVFRPGPPGYSYLGVDAATYHTPVGGAVVDAECRAALEQLSVDVANLKHVVTNLAADDQAQWARLHDGGLTEL